MSDVPTDPTSKALNASVDRRISTWPKIVRDFDPGPSDPVARDAWAEKMEPLAKKAMRTPGTTPPEIKRMKEKADAAKAENDKPAEKADATKEKARLRYSFEGPSDVKW